MLRRSLHSISSVAIIVVGKTLFIVLTANLYGPAGQGIVSLGIATSVTIGLFLSVGTELSNTRLLRGDPERVGVLRCNSAVLATLAQLASIPVVGVLFRLFGETIFQGLPPWTAPALMVLAGLQVYHLQIQALVVGLGRFRSVAISNLAQYVVLLAGLGVLFLAGWPAEAVLPVWGLGLIAKGGCLLLALPHGGNSASGAEMKRQVEVGGQMMFGNLANLLNFRLDAYFIAFFLLPADLGLYAVAAAVSEALLYVSRAFGQVLFAGASEARRPSSQTTLQLRNVFRLATHGALVVMLAAQVLIGWLLPSLFGKAFLAAVAPTRLLLVATFLYGIGLLAMNLIFGYGSPSKNTIAGMLAALINALCNVAAIPRWGILGAAGASLVSYSFYASLNLRNALDLMHSERSAIGFLLPDREYLSYLGRVVGQVLTRKKPSLEGGAPGKERMPRNGDRVE